MPINAVRMSHMVSRDREEWGPIHCDRPHPEFRLARIRKTIEALPATRRVRPNGPGADTITWQAIFLTASTSQSSRIWFAASFFVAGEYSCVKRF